MTGPIQDRDFLLWLGPLLPESFLTGWAHGMTETPPASMLLAECWVEDSGGTVPFEAVFWGYGYLMISYLGPTWRYKWLAHVGTSYLGTRIFPWANRYIHPRCYPPCELRHAETKPSRLRATESHHPNMRFGAHHMELHTHKPGPAIREGHPDPMMSNNVHVFLEHVQKSRMCDINRSCHNR